MKYGASNILKLKYEKLKCSLTNMELFDVFEEKGNIINLFYKQL